MLKRWLGMSLLALLLAVVAPLGATLYSPTALPVYAGPELDYQPSVVRVEPSGDLLMIIERLNPATFSGDLYQTVSTDNGDTWTTPQAVITSTLNQRHPALIQLGPQSFTLFYLTGSSGTSSYRIHRATSSDGVAWTEQGALDLGWATGGEVNPAVIREPDGTLTMVYQNLATSRSYVSQSTDGGVTWDKQKIPVADGAAALPRIAYRSSDDRYVVSYQINPGTNKLRLFTKTSSDALAWPATADPLSIDANSHDSQPMVLDDGRFFMTYIKQTGSGPFNVFYRTSTNGQNWSKETQITFDQQVGSGNVQPHPLAHGTPSRILLTWSHQQGVDDQNIMIETVIVSSTLYLPSLMLSE